MRDLVDLLDRETSLGEAVRDRAPRKVSGVLAPADPLLCDARHHLPVDHQDRGGIVSLGDAVFPLVEVGPVGALEGDGAFESADAEDLHGAGWWQEAYALRRVGRRVEVWRARHTGGQGGAVEREPGFCGRRGKSRCQAAHILERGRNGRPIARNRIESLRDLLAVLYGHTPDLSPGRPRGRALERGG